MTGNPKRVREIADELNKLVTELGTETIAPCAHFYGSAKSCITREKEEAQTYNHVRVRGHRGYHDYRPDEMCDACAAYWHASCAMARAMVAAKRLEMARS